MIKRTSRENVLEILKENSHKWNILDIGCNQAAVEYAHTVADIQNFSHHYKDKKFVLINSDKLPFKDNEFDFVYASHVIEHVDDILFFTKELKRISKNGYIELPTLLEDNIVLSDNSIKDHKWFFKFDDVKNILLAERKKQLIEPFVTHGVLFETLRKNFRSSLVLELIWENEIDLEIANISKTIKKLYFITILKKYLSYKIRTNKLIFIILILALTLIIFNF